MSTARRAVLPEVSGTRPGENAGLVLHRYLADPPNSNDSGVAKRAVLEAAVKAIPKIQPVYKLAFNRWKDSLPDRTRSCRIQSNVRVVIGLGGENVTETGLTLHQTYGVPYLPGPALKGLAAHYAHSVFGPGNSSWKLGGALHNAIFGKTDEGGLVTFHDGWITDSSVKTCLLPDVITPHHSDYYGSNEVDLVEATDFDRPIPVQMLSVKGAFVIAVSRSDNRLDERFLDTAIGLLRIALKEWGIGGKTSSGYGRFKLDDKIEIVGGSMPEEPFAASLPDIDTSIQVRLFELDESGQWRVESIEGAFRGTILNSEDIPAESAVLGSIVTVLVLELGDDQTLTFGFQ